MRKIIAIGGGEIGRPKEDGSGAYPVETTQIDQEIALLTEKKSPTLLFIATASGDSNEYFALVRAHFTKLGFSSIDPLFLSDASLTKQNIREEILSHDAIYVGGGNTLRMMMIWRRLGIDKMLNEALERDIVLSGISAGAICWFNSGNSDSRKFTSGSNKLIKVSGLGYVEALLCPHYDAEAFRQTDLKHMMKSTPGIAIALDNCAALEVVDDTYRVITSKPNATARKVYWKRGKYFIEEIPASAHYDNIHNLLKK